MNSESIAIENPQSLLDDALGTEWGTKVRSLEGILAQSLAARSPATQVIGASILRDGGKRMRPLLLLLSAGMAGYQGPDDVILASLVESIHAATLLHDDVLDEAHLPPPARVGAIEPQFFLAISCIFRRSPASLVAHTPKWPKLYSMPAATWPSAN